MLLEKIINSFILVEPGGLEAETVVFFGIEHHLEVFFFFDELLCEEGGLLEEYVIGDDCS